MTHPRALLFALSIATLTGCSCSDVSLGDDDAGDGGRVGPRLDECGNGLDDDGNGSIDDGCPCAPGETQRCFSGALASNGVGACVVGTQTCVAISGSEWGEWGLGDCDGEILPGTEACDGTDADCDGATDEGCPCTSGTTRDCGEGFVRAPCMGGTQTCRSGTWSRCEGAVGPSADTCGDDVDNDCDGLTDDMCDCPYPPAPERCSDAVDNDCDGTIDEPECTPDWTGDASVPLDAGPRDAPLPPPTCEPAAAPRCFAPSGSTRDLGAVAPVTYGIAQGLAVASTGEFLAVVTPDGAFWRVAGDGSLIDHRQIFSPVTAAGYRTYTLVWTGTSFILLQLNEMRRLDVDGTPIGDAVANPFPSRLLAIEWQGSQLVVVGRMGTPGPGGITELGYAIYDAALHPVTPPTSMGLPPSECCFSGINVLEGSLGRVAPLGSGWAVAGYTGDPYEGVLGTFGPGLGDLLTLPRPTLPPRGPIDPVPRPAVHLEPAVSSSCGRTAIWSQVANGSHDEGGPFWRYNLWLELIAADGTLGPPVEIPGYDREIGVISPVSLGSEGFWVISEGATDLDSNGAWAAQVSLDGDVLGHWPLAMRDLSLLTWTWRPARVGECIVAVGWGQGAGSSVDLLSRTFCPTACR